MRVFVQDLEGRHLDMDGIEGGQLVDKFKSRLSELTGVKPEEQTLVYLGAELMDGTLISQYNFTEDCVINMVHRSIGGLLETLLKISSSENKIYLSYRNK